jgi:hypothetical protein
MLGEVGPRLSPAWRAGDAREARVAAGIRRVVLGAERVEIEVEAEACADPAAVRLVLPLRLKHRQGSAILAAEGRAPPSTPRLDRTLVRAVCLARDWRRRLERGEAATAVDLARDLRLCKRHTARLLPLAYLAPDLVQMILEGRQPAALSLQALTAVPLPLAWADQRRRIASFA